MHVYYADSSVLVKRHVIESGSNWFRDMAQHGHENYIVSSQISEVEVCSAFSRRMREAELDLREFQEMMAEFDYVCATEYRIMQLTDSVVERAKWLLASHSLKAYDSIQLASAILISGSLDDIEDVDFSFLSADRRLLDVASAAGLQIFNSSSV